jgi:hypothetical protein
MCDGGDGGLLLRLHQGSNFNIWPFVRKLAPRGTIHGRNSGATEPVVFLQNGHQQ